MKSGPKIDGRTILKTIADRRVKRKKTSLYLSEDLFADFQNACGEEASASEVLEELMRLFVESSKGSKSK